VELRMNGETILCIAPRNFNSLWRNTQWIMWRLAAQNRVLYVEPGRNPDNAVLPELFRNLSNLFVLRQQPVSENLVTISSPPLLPHGRNLLPRAVLRLTMPLVTRFNAWLQMLVIRRVIKNFDVHDPILWTYLPFQVDLVGKCGEKLAVYFNYDELPDFIDNQRIKDYLRQTDNQLCRKVDVVFASSRAQCERRKAINPSTYLIPNAVDFDLFNRTLSEDAPPPPGIAGKPGPIVGFVGWLGFHIDVALLCRIAESFPEQSLVLIGPEELPPSDQVPRLHSLPNVYFLGAKPREDLPQYLRYIDVALMPYSLTGHILSAYPLKLHEYLAAGRAIVSTDLPEVYPFGDVVRIAKSHDEFLGFVAEAMDDNSPEVIAKRTAVARENTWDQRVEDIHRILDQRL
jgi:glycosyltransferase involved in cell wall biosynthesis